MLRGSLLWAQCDKWSCNSLELKVCRVQGMLFRNPGILDSCPFHLMATLSTIFFLMSSLSFCGSLSASLWNTRGQFSLDTSMFPGGTLISLRWLQGGLVSCVRLLKFGGGNILPETKSLVICFKPSKCAASACHPLAGLHTAPTDSYGNIPMDYHECRRRALYSETSLPPLCPKPFTEVLYCFMTAQ